MKKTLTLLFISMMLLVANTAVFAAQTDVFTVSSPIVQSMLAGSSQTLAYTLSAPGASQSNPVTIHCEFTSTDSANLGYSFNDNGCTNGSPTSGGVGIYNGLNDTVNLTLTTSSAASSSITGTLTFYQTNGRRTSKRITVPITIPASGNRVITFENYCPFSVAIGEASSSVPAKNNGEFHACSTNADCSAYTYSNCVSGFCGGGACAADTDCVHSDQEGTCAVPPGSPSGTTSTCTYCANDDDCLSGAVCNTTNNKCYWATPAPSNVADRYILDPKTGDIVDSATVTLTDNSATNGYSLMWGGGFAGRTGCTYNSDTQKLECDTGNCNTNGIGDGNGGCAIGEGFDAPVTQAEMTFVSKTPDTYDITLINGLTIPLSMMPTPEIAVQGHHLSRIMSSLTNPYENPYICGIAGSTQDVVTTNGTLGACSWEFTPPDSSLAYRWVAADDGTACDSDSACEDIDSAYRCGLRATDISTGSGSGATVCGTALGYWNQNEICASNASFNVEGIVDCTASGFGGNTLINLLQCTGDAATSCFNINESSTTCCGCTNWQNQGITVPTDASIVSQCLFPNSTYWGDGATSTVTGQVLPGLVWLKSACPSAYVYPFDDKASTFTCPSNNGQSAIDYTVTFCPGGKTAGLPAGA